MSVDVRLDQLANFFIRLIIQNNLDSERTVIVSSTIGPYNSVKRKKVYCACFRGFLVYFNPKPPFFVFLTSFFSRTLGAIQAVSTQKGGASYSAGIVLLKVVRIFLIVAIECCTVNHSKDERFWDESVIEVMKVLHSMRLTAG